jgi:hypothetical protein
MLPAAFAVPSATTRSSELFPPHGSITEEGSARVKTELLRAIVIPAKTIMILSSNSIENYSYLSEIDTGTP